MRKHNNNKMIWSAITHQKAGRFVSCWVLSHICQFVLILNSLFLLLRLLLLLFLFLVVLLLCQGGPRDVDLTVYDWFAGTLNKEDAKRLLAPAPLGSFLVRLGTSSPYVLSVRADMAAKNADILNFRIKKEASGWMLAMNPPDGRFFTTVPELMSFYREQPSVSGVKLATPRVVPGRYVPPAAAAQAPPAAAPAALCPACKNPVERGDQFCGTCGSPCGGAAPPPAAAPAAARRCTGCQQPVKPEERFCGSCGTQQQQ